MSETINDLKGAVRAFLSAHAQPVPAKTATSKKEHLEVWHVGALSAGSPWWPATPGRQRRDANG